MPGVAYGDTWTYNGVNWVQQQPVPLLKRVVFVGGLAGACEDCGQAFTFDGSTKGMLLFGAWVSDFQFTNNTWLFWLL